MNTIAEHKNTFDPEKIRKDFPIFAAVEPYGKPLIYLDNAASSQKPQIVLDRLQEAYTKQYANVHRGLHYLANEATIAFENARDIVKNFVNADSTDEIIWTAGATDGLNLIADSLGSSLKEGDEIILSIAEHHSNIVPWHFLRERKGCVLKWLDVDEKGDISLDQLDRLLTDRTKIIAITHMSNILGTINPIKEIAKKAHDAGALIVVDGSQGAVHVPVDVKDLDVDFYVTTGHKLYGPTGIGFIYGRKSLLENMRPYRGGGEMIDQVTRDNVTYNTPPHRFEAGTPQIVQAIGLGTALEYMMSFDTNALLDHEKVLTEYTHQLLSEIDDIQIYGQSSHKGGVISFNIKGLHPHDLATYVDRKGIAIRAGHHCGQPLMKYLGVSSTARASFALYNTKDDILAFVESLKNAIKFFDV